MLSWSISTLLLLASLSMLCCDSLIRRGTYPSVDFGVSTLTGSGCLMYRVSLSVGGLAPNWLISSFRLELVLVGVVGSGIACVSGIVDVLGNVWRSR